MGVLVQSLPQYSPVAYSGCTPTTLTCLEVWWEFCLWWGWLFSSKDRDRKSCSKRPGFYKNWVVITFPYCLQLCNMKLWMLAYNKSRPEEAHIWHWSLKTFHCKLSVWAIDSGATNLQAQEKHRHEFLGPIRLRLSENGSCSLALYRNPAGLP